MEHWSALVLAAAAGLNPWLTLLIVAALATFTDAVALDPGVARLTGVGPVLLLAVLLGVDVVAGKVPRLQRPTEVLSGVAAPLAGGLLLVALPAGAPALPPAPAFLAGAAVAGMARLGRRWAALALHVPLGGYRFGYALATMTTNTLAATLTAATLAVDTL